MHAQHTLVQRMIIRQCGKSQHRGTARDVGLLDEINQFLVCITQFHALSHQHKGAFGVVNQLYCLLYRCHIGIWHRVVTAYIIHLCRLIFYHLCLCTLGKVEYHRTRSAALGDIESTCHRLRNVVGIANHVAPLRNRLRQAHPIDLLKSVGTQGTHTHLSGYYHNRRTVNHRVSDASNGIGSPRATGHKTDTHFTRHPGKAFCCMSSTLFMSHQYMVKLSQVVIQGIIHRHDTTTRIAEYGLHSLMLQCSHQRFRSRYLFLSHSLQFELIILHYSSLMILTAPLSAELTIEAYACRLFGT